MRGRSPKSRIIIRGMILRTSPRVMDSPKGNSKNRGCFICDGPHRMKDCSKREKLSAIVAESSKDGDGDEDGRSAKRWEGGARPTIV